jgi:hypothetical protein
VISPEVLGFLILFNAREMCSLRRTFEFGAFFIWEAELSRQPLLRGLEADTRNGKGCDIGYALAANSCEGANSVEACTVTALDAITAFAVPNPDCPSQSRRFFQVWGPSRSPRQADHSAYFGPAKFHFGKPFQPSTGVTLNTYFRAVNAAFRCKPEFEECVHRGLQSVELLTLSEWMA